MRCVLCLLLGLLALTGCETLKGPKVDNPVVGPPPPRIPPSARAEQRPTELALDKQSGEPAKIEAVSFEKNAAVDVGKLPETAVVATVNEQPVFVGELLEPYRAALKKAEKQASPSELERFRETVIRRDLPATIERKLLVQGLTGKLKDTQRKALDKHLDELEEAETQKRMKQLGVTSKREYQELLESEGHSYEQWRQAYREKVMAQEAIGVKLKRRYEPTREELLQYYQEHIADYEYPVKVRWQQIVISDRAHGDRSGAKRVLVKVLDALLAGEDFAELAKQYSDGSTAKSGGMWDWTQAGSLADKSVEAALFELPVGEASPAIPTANGFQIVRILERQDAGRTSFEEVQEEIKETLKKDVLQHHIKEALSGVREQAVIRTVFDASDEPALDAAERL